MYACYCETVCNSSKSILLLCNCLWFLKIYPAAVGLFVMPRTVCSSSKSIAFEFYLLFSCLDIGSVWCTCTDYNYHSLAQITYIFSLSLFTFIDLKEQAIFILSWLRTKKIYHRTYCKQTTNDNNKSAFKRWQT